MKRFRSLILLPGIFFFASSSLAVESKKQVLPKPKTHQCVVLKSNAHKARKLYEKNRATAQDLNKQVKLLKKDQKRMPANDSNRKEAVTQRIHKLSDTKIQKLAISLKYLERHIQFLQEAKKTCSVGSPKRMPSKRSIYQKIDRYLNIAQNQ